MKLTCRTWTLPGVPETLGTRIALMCLSKLSLSPVLPLLISVPIPNGLVNMDVHDCATSGLVPIGSLREKLPVGFDINPVEAPSLSEGIG